MSSNSQSFSYSYYSSSTSSNGGAPERTTYAERSVTDSTGTKTESVRKLPGQAPVYESTDQGGSRRVEGGGAETQNRITDVTNADQQYEERMEDEYAKREGGA
ncbi:hypothetical protein F5Y12DRAFT_780465 [Xylaria sp. FL1777]|nr:hypothetical protein F5Y12DRAFT_780465 [Xylaria sp. FL1777]